MSVETILSIAFICATLHPINSRIIEGMDERQALFLIAALSQRRALP